MLKSGNFLCVVHMYLAASLAAGILGLISRHPTGGRGGPYGTIVNIACQGKNALIVLYFVTLRNLAVLLSLIVKKIIIYIIFLCNASNCIYHGEASSSLSSTCLLFSINSASVYFLITGSPFSNHMAAL